MLLHPCTTAQHASADVAADAFKTPERRLGSKTATRADAAQVHPLPAYERVLLPARPTCPLCFAEFSSLPGLSAHLTGGYSFAPADVTPGVPRA